MNIYKTPLIINYLCCKLKIHNSNMGMGDWGLGFGDWGLGPIPNPQSPIPINYIN